MVAEHPDVFSTGGGGREEAGGVRRLAPSDGRDWPLQDPEGATTAAPEREKRPDRRGRGADEGRQLYPEGLRAGPVTRRRNVRISSQLQRRYRRVGRTVAAVSLPPCSPCLSLKYFFVASPIEFAPCPFVAVLPSPQVLRGWEGGEDGSHAVVEERRNGEERELPRRRQPAGAWRVSAWYGNVRREAPATRSSSQPSRGPQAWPHQRAIYPVALEGARGERHGSAATCFAPIPEDGFCPGGEPQL